ncbi:hypothetical protein UN64_02825 [Fictibacillus arsenicus]|uniref:Uncharacterized protein n=1 Tax=Fictibacillus arsenicus TaxID=255247 RepID=A0A1V3GCP5_9BACL|nr:hypothetical protein UN64_02825 [Fictibacillus arsenicus]
MWLIYEENGDLLLFEDDGDYPFYYLFGQVEAFLKWKLPIWKRHKKEFNLPLSIFLLVDNENDGNSLFTHAMTATRKGLPSPYAFRIFKWRIERQA